MVMVVYSYLWEDNYLLDFSLRFVINQKNMWLGGHLYSHQYSKADVELWSCDLINMDFVGNVQFHSFKYFYLIFALLLCHLDVVEAFDGGDAVTLVIGALIAVMATCACLGCIAKRRSIVQQNYDRSAHESLIWWVSSTLIEIVWTRHHAGWVRIWSFHTLESLYTCLTVY